MIKRFTATFLSVILLLVTISSTVPINASADYPYYSNITQLANRASDVVRVLILDESDLLC